MSYYSSSIPYSDQQIIEHLVLLKFRPNTNPKTIDSVINNLNGLKTLDVVLHISSGPITRTISSLFPFTHLLHGRYTSVEAYDEYTAHPRHMRIAEECLPLCDDVIIIDWVSVLSGPVEILPGKAMRINLVKLKEGVDESGKKEIFGVMGGIKEKFDGIKEKFDGIEELSYGENFSHAVAKGFSTGSSTVVPGLEELEGLDSKGVNEEKEKIKKFIESMIVLDYLIPQVEKASL